MPVGDALVSAGASIVGDAINAISTGHQNKKARQFAEKMYGRQREDALADWNRQNAYDSPAAQMGRYKDAGLNPLLIYGNGSSSAGNSSPVRSSSPGSYSPRVPQVDLAAAVHSYIDAKFKDQQIDNLKEMNKVLFLKQALGGADLIGLQLKNQFMSDTMTDREGVINAMRYRAQMLNDQNEKLMPVSLEAAKAHVAQIRASTKFTLDEDQRQAVMNSANLAIAAKRVLLMEADLQRAPLERSRIIQLTQNLNDDALLKHLDSILKQQKIGADDPTFIDAVEKVVGHVLQGALKKPVTIRR